MLGAFGGYFSVVPLDWFILGGIAVVFAIDALRSGLGRANAVAVALPVALVLNPLVSSAVPLHGMKIGQMAATTQVGIFAVLFVLAYLFLRRMGFDYIDSGMGEPIQSILGGAAVAVIVLLVWLSVPSLHSIWSFEEGITNLFSESFRLWWYLGAYSVLAFARG